MHMKIILTVFLKKSHSGINRAFWARKWHAIITLDLIRIFFKFWRKKEAKRHKKIILMVFPKKIWFVGKWAILGPKLVFPRNSVYTLRSFSKFCTMKGAKRHMKIILMIFPKKNLVQGKWAFLGPKIVHPHNFGSAQMMFFRLRTEHGRGQEVIIRGYSNVFLLHRTLVYAQVYMPRALQITRQNFDKIIII